MSRDNIKKAARELFRRYSYVKTSVSDIAAAAGIGKGSVYLSFKTKEEILFALLTDEINAIKATSDPIYLDPTITLDDKLGRFSREILDLHFQIRDIMFGSLDNVQGRELQDVYLKFAAYIDQVAEFMAKVLELHGYPAHENGPAVIREFILFLSGRFIIYILSHDWNNRDEIYRLMPEWTHLIFDTLVKREPTDDRENPSGGHKAL